MRRTPSTPIAVRRAAPLAAGILLATAAIAGADEQPKQIVNGVAVGAEFSFTAITVNNNNNGPSRSAVITGGFLAGYKIDRVLVSLGVNITRLSIGSSSTGVPNAVDTSQSTTSVSLTPGVQVALLRSADRRVELYAEFDLGWLHFFSDHTPATTSTTTTSDNGLVYRIGPGLRYWIHPSFAFYVIPTLRGQFQWSTTSSSDGTVSATDSAGVTTIDANLGFLGVF